MRSFGGNGAIFAVSPTRAGVGKGASGSVYKVWNIRPSCTMAEGRRVGQPVGNHDRNSRSWQCEGPLCGVSFSPQLMARRSFRPCGTTSGTSLAVVTVLIILSRWLLPPCTRWEVPVVQSSGSGLATTGLTLASQVRNGYFQGWRWEVGAY